MNNYSNNTRSMNGLNNINANALNSNEIDVDILVVNTSGTCPTRPNGDNSLNLANTAFVTNAVSGSIITNYVTTNTSQTISGLKDFSVLPTSSVIPTTNNQLVNKNYVDNGVFVNLTSNQDISGVKTFNNNVIVGSGINTKTGSNLVLTTTGGEDVVVNGSNDITFNSAFNTVFNAGAYGSFQAGVGYTFVCNGGYGFKFIDNAIGGGFESTTSNNIVNTSVNNYDYNTASLFSPYINGPNRAGIYSNTSTVLNPTITFNNGQATDLGVSFSALLVSVPVGSTCSMIRVSIPFDLLAWSTFGLPASAISTIGLTFDSFSVVYLKNGIAYNPTKQYSYSSATGTTINWTKGASAISNIQGMGAYFGNLEIAFNIDINNTSVDSYQVRVTPNATINNFSINFDAFKFVCKSATGSQTNGNGFRTTSVTSYSGGSLTFAGGNPTFVDTSVTKISLSYPVPDSSNYAFMPLNNNITPAGMISQYVISTPPAGWLVCNGASISISTYGNLFNVIAFTYGGSFASGNFNLPNFSGVFIRSAGSQTIGGITYTAGAVGTPQQDMALTTPLSGYTTPLSSTGFRSCAAGTRDCIARTNQGDPIENPNGLNLAYPSGRGGAEVRPVNHSLYYIIKY